MDSGRTLGEARLGVVDEIFLRGHRGWGNLVVMQGLWRCADRIEPALLASVHDALAHGRLGRRVVRSRVPLARPRFVPDASTFPVEYRTVSDLTTWADEQAAHDVDPENGPGWRMSVARLEDGGTAVSLVCSHVIADARGLASAIESALTGAEPVEMHQSATSDVRDAMALVGRVATRTLAAVVGLIRHPERRHELRSRTPEASISSPEACTRLIVELDADDWRAAAERDGGTPNSLFISVIAELARTHPDDTVVVSVPMDMRSIPGIDNAVAMVEVEVAAQDSGGRVRDNSRAAYASPPMSSPAGFPDELLQVVPDRAAHSLSSSAGERDALCSNIGRLPEGVRTLGPHTAGSIATRAVHPGPLRTRSRIFAFFNEFDGSYTLALESTVDRSRDQLRRRTADALNRKGLRPRSW
ncbi:hypothetical protein [Rhodococcus sp. NPDC058521]|uniref:hypothetical protein n=1 Tax=Rhodococcus sp. NPDC058521 TaxID=3346536 RepID=UPI00364C25C3